MLSQRGSKLKGAHEELFSGAFWTGVKAKELGLIDGLGELREIMQDRLGEDVLFKNYAPKTGILSKLGLGSESVSGISKDFTINSMLPDAMEWIEQRATWGRFGL